MYTSPFAYPPCGLPGFPHDTKKCKFPQRINSSLLFQFVHLNIVYHTLINRHHFQCLSPIPDGLLEVDNFENNKLFIPEPTAPSAVPGVSPGRGLLIPHGYLNPGKSEHSEVQSPSIIAGASLCFMGGPPTDLKNMTDRQEQSFFYKKICKKAFIIKNCFAQHDAKYFFELMVRIELFITWKRWSIYGKFVLTVHVFDFVVLFAYCPFKNKH